MKDNVITKLGDRNGRRGPADFRPIVKELLFDVPHRHEM
jgi:hypothetical protein